VIWNLCRPIRRTAGPDGRWKLAANLCGRGRPDQQRSNVGRTMSDPAPWRPTRELGVEAKLVVQMGDQVCGHMTSQPKEGERWTKTGRRSPRGTHRRWLCSGWLSGGLLNRCETTTSLAGNIMNVCGPTSIASFVPDRFATRAFPFALLARPRARDSLGRPGRERPGRVLTLGVTAGSRSIRKKAASHVSFPGACGISNARTIGCSSAHLMGVPR